ncbi:MAG TPA: glycosyl hydrolase family 65 protein, partial [Rhodopila sp.]|nr:glycosyl hydrolase family 65 protein [Rhodopila sp.]
LPEEFRPGADIANFRYYEARCSHDSSLSPAMHGLVAARLGETERALNYFRQAAAIDLTDTNVTIGQGVHIAALGGLWSLAVFGFGGLAFHDDRLEIQPRLPAGWHSLSFSIQWRRRHLSVHITQDGHQVEVKLVTGESMAIVINGQLHQIEQGAVAAAQNMAGPD